MIDCPYCNHKSLEFSNFCQNCGKKINPTISANFKENKDIIKNILLMSNIEYEKLMEELKDTKILSDIIQKIKSGTFTSNPNMGRISEDKIYKMIIAESIRNNYDFDDKTKENIINILNCGYDEARMPHDIIRRITQIFNGNESLAVAIQYTETMQASNLSNWGQAIIEGSKYFIVDYDITACSYCNEKYKNEVFNIEQLSMLPPIHFECGCVPIFFMDKEEALMMSKDILQRNEI